MRFVLEFQESKIPKAWRVTNCRARLRAVTQLMLIGIEGNRRDHILVQSLDFCLPPVPPIDRLYGEDG